MTGRPARDSEVSEPVLYCRKHEADVSAPGGFPHAMPLFSKKVMAAWREHYARRYPQLDWSKRVVSPPPPLLSPYTIHLSGPSSRGGQIEHLMPRKQSL